MKFLLPIFFLLVLFAVFVLSTAAVAQEKSAGADTSKTREFDVEKRKQDVKILLDKVEILGRIDKPQTVFIVPGKDPKVEDIQIDRSFFDEMFREVEWDNTRKRIEQAREKSRKK